MARSAQKKVVFVSHSSRDHQIVNAFVDRFLPDTALTSDTTIINASTDDPHGTRCLREGESIWDQIRTNLRQTACFIACLSDSYFKSNWCIAELAVFHEMFTRNRRLLLCPLLIDPDSETWRANPFTQPSKQFRLSEEKDLNRLVVSMERHGLLHKSSPYPTTHRSFVVQLNLLLNERDQRSKGFLADLARDHFSHPQTLHGPLTCLVRRAEYEQISVNMAERAKLNLLWTLFKSPLLVADAYRNDPPLMPYDMSFENFTARKRIRLVIFLGPKMARAYAETDVAYHIRCFNRAQIHTIQLSKDLLLARKDKFQESAKSHGGVLLFTLLERLPQCFPDPKPRFRQNSFLEFAYSDYEGTPNTCLLLESGFTSEFSNVHARREHTRSPLLVRHVTFYSAPGPDCSKAIQGPPYKGLFGHLDNLQRIAETLFRSREPDPKIFVTSDNIHELYEGTA